MSEGKINEIMVAAPGRPAVVLEFEPWEVMPFFGQERVYFVVAPSAGLVKIGTSWRLPHRLAEIAALSPVPVHLIGHVAGGRDREEQYHTLFASERSHGEWFRYSASVAEKIGVDGLIDAWNRASPKARSRFYSLVGEA